MASFREMGWIIAKLGSQLSKTSIFSLNVCHLAPLMLQIKPVKIK